MKIAFVCPFFGAEASGGAEFAARSLALHLAEKNVEVDILTTCLKDLPHGLTHNVHPEGISRDGPLCVRRFPVEQADMQNFGMLNELVISRQPIPLNEELQFMTRHVTSPSMIAWMAAHRDDYTHFCFIPYLFGTTCFGVQVAPSKSIVIPCFHDEGYASLQLVRRMTQTAARFVFNAPAEQRFAQRTFSIPDHKCTTVGLGVETDIAGDAERFREQFGLHNPFVLYVGRRDTTKNVHTLIQYFLRYKKNRPGPLKLVLIGSAPLPAPGLSDDLVDLGFVSEQEKLDACAAADVFCNPSLNESFSYVLMEAWLCGTPCLVHEDCEVTRDHVVASRGGLYFRNAADFAGALDRLRSQAGERQQMAQAGSDYVKQHYAWPEIVRRYKTEVFAMPA